MSGYSAACKTGTAQKIDSTGAYSKAHFIASFVGFAPASRPAVTILVTIDSPVGAIHGAEVAAPAFKQIAEETLSYLSIPQDNPSPPLQVVASALASSSNRKVAEKVSRSHREPEYPAGLQPASFSTKTVMPTPSAEAEEYSEAIPVNDGPLVTMPDFKGMPVRQVADLCQRLGLDLNLGGSGLAADQSPAAGTQIPAGARVMVHFAR